MMGPVPIATPASGRGRGDSVGGTACVADCARRSARTGGRTMKVPTRRLHVAPGATGRPGSRARRAAVPSSRALLGWYRSRRPAPAPARPRATRGPSWWPRSWPSRRRSPAWTSAWAGFLERFPTPRALADASPADVRPGLGRAWATTGARSQPAAGGPPHRGAARRQGAGAASRSWRRCPASGRTRRGPWPLSPSAIPVAAVDTNVRRVVGRILGGPVDATRTAGRRRRAGGRAATLPPGRTRPWSSAPPSVAPARPACAACPVRRWCASAEPWSRRPERYPAARAGSAPSPGRPGARGAWHSRPRRAGCGAASWPTFGPAEDGAWVRLPEPLGSHGPARHRRGRGGAAPRRAAGAACRRRGAPTIGGVMTTHSDSACGSREPARRRPLYGPRAACRGRVALRP